MGAVGFNHFNLRAPGALLDELKTFYIEILGLAEGPRPSLGTPGHWLYVGKQCVLHLSRTRPGEIRHTHIPTTFDHIAFTCIDLLEMKARLERNNIQFRTGQVPSLGITQIFIQDPAGNGIELSFASEQA
ncbi:MAG TPA: VOC family protein [Nitrosospira sp.]|nr:VOC family protein [Nitrosospira sp.]